MPNNYDFSKISGIKTCEIDIDGWISPVIVEYGTGFHGEIPSYFWRVRGTHHTFVIPILRMDYLSQGEYGKHFKEVLQAFREDFIGWSKEGWYAPWMQQYREQFSKHISL